MDWIDEILQEQPASLNQISIIEGLLPRVPYIDSRIKEIEDSLDTITNQDAYELIFEMKQDEIPSDPREQFKKMFRHGN